MINNNGMDSLIASMRATAAGIAPGV